MAEALEKWQDVLREELLKVGIVGVQQPLVHNGRIVLESDGRKAFIHKRDNHVLTLLAERYLPEWQQVKKVDIITHEGTHYIADIPEQYALVLDTRLLTQEQFTYLRNIAAGYDERKQQQGKKETAALVIESEVTNG
jgi:hypothetical protein